jgi:hypothetical protein
VREFAKRLAQARGFDFNRKQTARQISSLGQRFDDQFADFGGFGCFGKFLGGEFSNATEKVMPGGVGRVRHEYPGRCAFARGCSGNFLSSVSRSVTSRTTANATSPPFTASRVSK